MQCKGWVLKYRKSPRMGCAIEKEVRASYAHRFHPNNEATINFSATFGCKVSIGK
ncbi:hypothetical protein E1A91_A11G128800v1 [Gossypium mustelinum]|uniref:Uncharacterized protein n=3 Tax=Gossypium TaxID=3633 RepID=A0A5J5TRK5_GOSBA|nr:hypothetical protein ES319_A11G125200v1 [Gossypium barbadense]TYG93731.1 hypothetical protein ES288_A11G134000v1 [Gossypium darwinii]TYJ09254.1 hypothetical protein E1A91_A11G128800v1 [Gossypium mustelinum]